MGSGVHFDSFSHPTVADLKKSMRTENGILCALNYHTRVSTWDMSENPWLVDIIDSLIKKGLIVEVKEPYPWHRFMVTNKGREQITI